VWARRRLRSRGGREAICVVLISKLCIERGVRGGDEVLVAIRHEEIWIQCPKVEMYVAHAVRAVDAAQYAQVFACGGQALEGHAYAGHADDGVEDGDFDFAARGFDGGDFGPEFRDQPVVFDRVRVADLDGLGGRGFGHVGYGLLARPVDGREVEDVVARLEVYVA
jgi:hypothetical protein